MSNQLLTEIERIKNVMGVTETKEESKRQMNVNLRKIVETLQFLKL